MDNSTRDLPPDPWPRVNPEKWTTTPSTVPNRTRLWLALLIGCALALPAGWLLAPLAVLPGELGLFFFLVIGLIIGAILYRISRPAAPAPRPTLYLIGLAVAVLLWVTGLVVEYRFFPDGAVRAVRVSFNRVLPAEKRSQIDAQVRQHAFSYLKDRYPPGGFVGYVRWAATDGKMDLPRVIDHSTAPYALPQRHWGWLIRVVLSILFAAGAILSQLLALARNPAVEERTADSPPPSF